jgi:hypothetical protein
MKWPFFRKKKKETKPDTKQESEKTQILCFATGCYFNAFYRGCIDCCDLKTVELTAEGKCRHYLSRDDGRKLFYKEKDE